MKTKILNLTIIKIFFILFTIYYFSSCDENLNEDKWDSYKVITIDSCEYIEFSIYTYSGNQYLITHKGNCKFCLKRNKK